ncbi:MAG: 2-oxoacid:acceptor oxidoreductase subunit alpha, partial [Acidobacteria bacterium]|nr:2-oxoacid:acceptor oxidoreductase subunit alpha [Acidobacteriota bacterium]
AAWFARGSGHDEYARYTERPIDYVRNMDRLARKFETARKMMPAPEIDTRLADIGIIAYGTSHWAVEESREQLRAESRLETDYLRIRAFPFSSEVEDFIRCHRRVYVVEQNRDAQMRDLLALDLGIGAEKMRSVLHYNGLPIDARTVTASIQQQEESIRAATVRERTGT